MAKYIPCSWVNEGMAVWAPVMHEGKRKSLRCTVTVAAGKLAYVENKSYGFAKWFDVLDLYREATEVEFSVLGS